MLIDILSLNVKKVKYYFFHKTSKNDDITLKLKRFQINNYNIERPPSIKFDLNSIPNPRVTSSNPRVMSSSLRVTISNLPVTSSNPRIRTLKAQVARLKARIGRLKPQVKRLKVRLKRLKT